MTKNIKKVSDKLTKASDSFIVYMYDNGFMVEVGGRNKDNEWATAKILVSNVEELTTLIQEVTSMERE